MSPIRHRLLLLVLVAFQLVNPTFTLSSHSPQDLLAYPKYSVSLQDWNFAITNSTATSILSAEFQSDSDSRQSTDELSLVGSSGSHSQDEGPSFRNKLMRTASGKAFFCKVPELPIPKTRSAKSPSTSLVEASLANQDNSQIKQERVKMEQEGLMKGLELISSLKDRCIYTRLGWFTYSFCYGKGEIRQFHALMVPGHSHPHEDPNQDVYVLGLHVDHPHNPHHQARLDGTLPTSTALAAEGELTSLGKNRFSSTSGPTMGLSDVLREESTLRSEALREEDEFEQKRYLVQRWDGGTLCDMTGKPRSVEVQFHCSTIATDHIALLRETSICEYLVVIHTPRLCSEPLFLDGGGRKGIGGGEDVSTIECQPVLSDEEIDKWKAKEAARKRRKAEEETRKQKMIEEQRAQAENSITSGADGSSAGQTRLEGTSDVQDGAEVSETVETPASEATTPALSDSSQIVLDDKTAPQPASTGKTEDSGSSPTDQEENPKTGAEEKFKTKTSGPRPQILEIDPITVYIDADTGHMYMDESATPDTSERPAAAENAGPNVPTPDTRQTQQTDTHVQGDEPADDLEGLTKALKESLGALLRDLRATEQGVPRAPPRAPQRADTHSLSKLIAALKDSDGPSRKLRSAQHIGRKNTGKSDSQSLKSSSQRRMSEEHLKMLKMYESKFELSEENNEDKEHKKAEK